MLRSNFLLTSLLASWLATQTWFWDAVPGVSLYRLYWQAGSPTQWCQQQYQEAPCCEADLTIPPPGGIVYFNVVAVSDAGVESTWDHGVKVVCP